MKVLIQISFIFFLVLFGSLISTFLPIPIPGSVISMIILFLALYFKWIKVDSLKETGDFLLNNMGFFFIPAGVGIVSQYGFFKDSALQFLAVCIIAGLITFIATAYTVLFVIKLGEKLSSKKEGNKSNG